MGQSFAGMRLRPSHPNAYEGGFLFAGRLADGYAAEFGSSYYFRKTKHEYRGIMYVTEMEDLYVKASAPIQSHDAIKLPSWDSPRWRPAREEDAFVELSSTQASLGKWKLKESLRKVLILTLTVSIPMKRNSSLLPGAASHPRVCRGTGLSCARLSSLRCGGFRSRS